MRHAHLIVETRWSLLNVQPGTVADALQTLLPEREKLTAAIVEDIRREIPALGQDARMMSLLQAAASENVAAVMHAIAHGTKVESVDAPTAGIEHARILAQREVSVTDLLRAYRLGQARFLEGAFNGLKNIGLDPGTNALELVHLVSVYIDRVSEQVVQAYGNERELRAGSKAALLQYWVNQLMTDDVADVTQAEAALRYRLTGWHIAVEAWIDKGEPDESVVATTFDQLAALLRRIATLRGASLSVPTDAFQRRIWLQVGESFEFDPEALTAALVAEKLPVSLAIGDHRRGVAGFRSTALSARRVKTLATASADAPRVLAHSQVAPVALLVDDDAEVLNFITTNLRGLALPDPRNAGLRETLLVYLESNRSYHLAASRLHVHRNTVHYRVQQAIDVLGIELGPDTLSLQLALTICRWRGQILV